MSVVNVFTKISGPFRPLEILVSTGRLPDIAHIKRALVTGPCAGSTASTTGTNYDFEHTPSLGFLSGCGFLI